MRRSVPQDVRQSRLIRRQRIVIAIAVACALLSTASLAASRFVKSPAQLQAEVSAPLPSLITADVNDQVIATTMIFRGTVGSGGTVEITPQASGTSGASASIVTGVFVHAGERIKPGQVLLQVSGRPVIALRGAFPAYRDLKPGDDGRDVRELQRALASLGYFTGVPDGKFGPATKDAITRLYQALGYDVPTTGGPGDAGDRAALQAAQDAVNSAQRAVDDMKAQIAAAGAQPTPSATPGAPGTEPLKVQLRFLEQALSEAISSQQFLIATTGPEMPAAEVAFVPKFPARVVAVGGTVGSSVTAPLLTLSTGNLVVTDQMDPGEARLVRPGMPAQLDSEVLGASAAGKVSAVGQLTTPAVNTGGTGTGDSANASGQAAPDVPYVPVTITPSRRLPAAWNGQDVRVTVTSAKTTGKVLAVPVAAVTTRADGQTVVTRVLPDGATTEVVVHIGVSADGFVQVSPVGGRLAPGEKVSIGR